MDRSGYKPFRFDQIAMMVSERVDPTITELETYVGLEHLDSESIHIKRFGKPSDVKGQKLRVYPGDVIFGKRRAYQRKAAVAKFEGICSAHAMVLRANPKVILPELFPFFLHSDQFMHRAIDISVGSLSPTINWKTLRNQEFLLPPKEEQARLAELLWAMDEVVEANQKLFFGIFTFARSFSHHFFFNRNEQTIPLSDVGRWKSGGTPNKKKAEYWNGGIPWVSPKDMKMDVISKTIDTITELGVKAGSKLVPEKSLLMVVRGMILAHTFPVSITGKSMAFNQDMKALIPFSDFHPKILLYFLKFQAQNILALSSQSSHGTKSIPSDVLFSLRFPKLSQETQKYFVSQIEQIEDSYQNGKEMAASSKALLNSLINQIF